MTDEWEGGRRQGIRWGRARAVLLVVALVATVVLVARREHRLAIDTDNPSVPVETAPVEVVVTSPLQAGDRWYCPSTHPVRVYEEDGLYYPSEYPRGEGHIARPANCYQDAGRAQEDGYRLAPPPAGSALVGGVYLEPARAPTTQACTALAAAVGFTVPCPRHLPTPADGPTCTHARCEFGGGVIVEQRSFRVPAGWAGGADPHVVIAAAPVAVGHILRPRRPIVVDADEALVSCSPDDPVQPGGEDVIVLCPPAPPWVPGLGGYPHEQHTAAFWRRGRVVYAASVEGSTPQTEAVLRAVIDSIAYVEPPPR